MKCEICGEYTYISPICKKCAKQIIVDETDAAIHELEDITREREQDEPEGESVLHNFFRRHLT